jgi:hypothetical protein
VQADVHKDVLVESVVVLYPSVSDFGATSIRRVAAAVGQSQLKETRM